MLLEILIDPAKQGYNLPSRTIRIYGDPILRLTAAKVEEFGDRWLPLISDMFDTCESDEGAGLAAPQIGESIQLAVIMLRRENQEPFKLEVFNPKILETEGEESFEEGCLSIPGIREDVVRSTKIRLKYQDYQGQWHEVWADGLLARVLQHEIDHLHGVLFVDHLPKVKKLILKSKLKSLEDGEIPDEE